MHYLDGNFDYYGWGWIVWFGLIFLLFSSFGNWGYAYSAHRKFDRPIQRDAMAILNERYAGGELTRVQFLELKADIASS